MTQASIRRMRNLVRLPAGAESAQVRVDALLTDVLGRALDDALARRFSPGEEVYVRRVVVPIRFRMELPSEVLARQWAEAIADGICSSLELHGSEAFRMPSRRRALLAFVAEVAAGRRDRSWAWERLGFLPPGEGERPLVADDAIAALAERPREAIAVLIHLARMQSLSGLFGEVSEEALIRFSTRVLAEYGARRDLLTVVASESERSRDVAERAQALATRSPLAGVVGQLGQTDDVAVQRAIGMLIIASIEPAALAGEGAALLAEAVYYAMCGGGARSAGASGLEDAVAEGRRLQREHGTGDSPPTRREPAGALESSLPAVRRQLEEAGAPETRARGEAGLGPKEEDTSSGGGEVLGEGGHSLVQPVRAATRWGGLPFLLRGVGYLDLAAHPITAGARTVRWLLHQLGQVLVPIEPDDPALLAFAGLGPHELTPDQGEPAASDVERAEVEALAHRLAAWCADAVGRHDEDALTVVHEVCARWATIVWDPAWLTVEFSLDDVSIDIRRAGLDLDLGWLPWLGAVVVFAYV